MHEYLVIVNFMPFFSPVTGSSVSLARIMHHAVCFFAPVEQMRASDPSCRIGVRQLAGRRVWV
jgi:hypothetical protein